MIVSINQPAYLPWLGYFERIERSDIHIVLDHVQFEKNSFVNRNKIRSKDNVIWLTVPLSTKGKFGKLQINNLEIASQINWQRKHWQTIKTCLSRAKYFKHYETVYESIYLKQWSSFMPFASSLLEQHLSDLSIKTPIIYSSTLSPSGTKSDLILNLLQSVGATTYISGSQGRQYLNEQAFVESGIQLEYQDYSHPVYTQAFTGFKSHLSILDLLFNYGSKSLDLLMNNKG